MKELRKKIRNILAEEFFEGGENLNGYTLEINMPVKQNDKKDIWEIKELLKKHNFKMYIVGGATRDTVKNAIKLQKNPMDTTIDIPKDFDLVTDATPNEVNNIFKNADFISNILNIGESFAIEFLVTKNGNKYELATLRSESGGGRKPDYVQYEKTIEKDAQRRDLKINALYYKILNETENGFYGIVYDLVGGIRDIKNNELNTVGNPTDRFAEDPLRKLRAIRFAARMGSKIPGNVADAIKDGDTSLIDPTGKIVSNERIRDEFYKGIKGSKSIKYFLDLLAEFNFFKHIFADLKINPNYFIEEKHPIILVSNLLKDNNIKEISKNLTIKKYSIDEINCIIFLISLINLDENAVSAIKKFYLQKIKNAKPKINEKIYSMTDDVIYKFANIGQIDKIKVHNLLRLANEFIQPSELLKSLGYQDKDLGIAITRLEKEFYNNPDRIKKILDSKNAEEIKKIIFISKA
jgi:tRNA nucleotidyltransferase/poly(A) polymerase